MGADAREAALVLLGSKGRRIREGRRVYAALAALYPDRAAPASRLCGEGRPGAVAQHMLRSGYVCRDARTRPAMYSLTFAGRCRALCSMLGVSMLGLCIMAESYVTHASQAAAGRPASYPLRGAADLLGEIYAMKSIRNAVARLRVAGHVVPVRRGAVRLTPEAMRRLSRAGPTVYRLHEMLVGLPYQLDVMSLESGAAGRTARPSAGPTRAAPAPPAPAAAPRRGSRPRQVRRRV